MSSTELRTPTLSGGQQMSFDYDRYGNRWHQTITAGTGTNVSLTFDQTSNKSRAPDTPRRRASGTHRLALFAKRWAEGHQRWLALLHSGWTYDAENRMLTVDGLVTYTYDAFGRRVKVAGTGARNRECIYDLANNCFAEVDERSGTWMRSDVRAFGQTIATYDNQFTGMYFDHAHLHTATQLAFQPFRL